MKNKALWLLAGSCVLLSTAWAQDSVAISGGLPGDALNPYADAMSAFGSEQRNNFVVDLTPFKSSWNQDFAIAPILKSSKVNTAFFTSLFNSQAISRYPLKNRPYAAANYAYWNAPGFGVNNDPAINTPGVSIDRTNRRGNQFAIAFAEYSNTTVGQSYNGIITAIVNYDPKLPNRLYVSRIVSAVNCFDGTGNLSQFGYGMVDPAGHSMFRADGSGSGNIGGLLRLTGNNIFNVDAAGRNVNIRNVISSDYPGGQFDAAATKWIIRNVGTTHNCNGLVPADLLGTATPLYIGTNFSSQYVRGFDFGTTVADTSHLAGPNVDHRGAVGYSTANHAWLGSTAGTVAILGKEPVLTNSVNVWGIDATGSVTGKEALILPAVVIDNETGYVNLPGNNEFNHYVSQTAFRGGSGQVALGTDKSGNLLAAAEVDHPARANDEPKNYIAVARRKPDGTVQWTIAGYCDAFGGKPITDGTGAVIGKMLPLPEVTGGTPRGPSVSAPMIDSMGNVYFVSALERNRIGFPERGIGLLRAVYNEANFSYRLELLAMTGDIFEGQNSKLKYRIDAIDLADSNSVDSATPFSSNIMETPYAGMNRAGIPNPRDPRSLGGLIFAATITYDQDEDGDFGGGVDPTYRVLLYVGARQRSLGTVSDSIGIRP